MNLKDMVDMGKLANEAKKVQQEQQRAQQQQVALLERIDGTLNEILDELKRK